MNRIVLCVCLWVFCSVITHGSTYRVGSSGQEIVELQQMLNAVNSSSLKADGFFGSKTEEELKLFQSKYGLTADGVYGPNTQKELRNAVVEESSTDYVVVEGDSLWTIARKFNTTTSAISQSNSISESSTLRVGQRLNIPKSATPMSRGMVTPTKTAAKILPWDTVDNMIRPGSTFSVYDVKSGISFEARRIGGVYHADSEPLTSKDTTSLKAIYSDEWSWDRRAVVITFEGNRLAASVNGMPHGADHIPDNDFSGMFCIHFLGSRVHVSNKVDPEHQAMIKYASSF